MNKQIKIINQIFLYLLYSNTINILQKVLNFYLHINRIFLKNLNSLLHYLFLFQLLIINYNPLLLLFLLIFLNPKFYFFIHYFLIIDFWLFFPINEHIIIVLLLTWFVFTINLMSLLLLFDFLHILYLTF